jgi:hypothetical protein
MMKPLVALYPALAAISILPLIISKHNIPMIFLPYMTELALREVYCIEAVAILRVTCGLHLRVRRHYLLNSLLIISLSVRDLK